MTPEPETQTSDIGWGAHPDFTTFSDFRLELNQALIDDSIRAARGRGDEQEVIYYEQRMRMLQAERKRRTGGTGFVSAPKETNRAETIFPLQTWGAFIETDFAEQPYTIQEFAPDSGLIAFHGRGKGGKSTVLFHCCRAIGKGEKFLGKPTHQKPVVYLNYEMGFSYLKELLVKGGPAPDEAYILNRPEPVLQISTIEQLMIGIGRPGVLVVDSFRGAFRLDGDGENSAGGAGLILRNIQDLAVKHNWLVIVVHHSNRSIKEGTDGISGTSDWIAAPDVIWSWSRPDKNKPGTFMVEGRMPPVDPVTVQLSPEECVCLGTVDKNREESEKTAILESLTDEGQLSKDIAEALKIAPSTVRKRLESFHDAGLATREGAGKRGDPYLYSRIVSAQPNPLGAETNRVGPNGRGAGLAGAALEVFSGGRIVS